MEFENSHKLKGYLESESKRLNIHSNYAYTYYFIRKFLEILYREHSDIFMVKGSISRMAHTLKLTRAITDADLASNIDLIDASYILEKTVKKNDDEIKFSIKNRFTTTNNTINFKILCNYGHIQQLIKMDLKHQESCDMVKKELPVIMKKDISFDISTYPLEMHIATKLYILLRNTDKTISISKERRRLKDFYDLHFLLQTNYNEELLCKYNESIKAVTVYNEEKQKYIDFWKKQYEKYPKEQSEIVSVVNNKLENGLIPLDEMVNLVKNSRDTHDEIIKILKFLNN